MKVMKFGGTSVGRPERMHQVAALVKAQQEPVVLVLSALSGTTNALVGLSQTIAAGKRDEAASQIAALETHYQHFIEGLLHNRAYVDRATTIVAEHFEFLRIILKISYSEALNKDILAQGELLSTKLFAVYLEQEGVDHLLLPALSFMSIDAAEEPELELISSRLNHLLQQHPGRQIYITQGYICKNARGEVDNLKRGGSDYTASLVAAALPATVCEIWTDIDGMHNNDPRVVDKTRPVEHLSFEEAAELAYFGAKILHPASIWPAQLHNVPVKLLNTMQPEAKGTVITEAAASSGVKAIAAKDGITAIKIKSSRMLLAYGFLRKIFEVFEKYRTPIDMIATSEVAVSLTIDTEASLEAIIKELKPFGTVDVDHNETIVSVVGHELASDAAILQKVFTSLQHVPVRMVSYGGSPHNISLLVPADRKKEVLQLLNTALFDF